MQEYAGAEEGGEEGYGQQALEYGAPAPAVMDAEYSVPTEGAAGFEAVPDPQADYSAPAAGADFAAGY